MSRRAFPLLTLIAPLALAACTPPGPAPLDTVVAGDTGPVTVARIQGSGERSPLEGRQVEFEAVVVAPFGGLGGVNLAAQLIGTAMGVAWAAAAGFVVYGVLKATMGLRLSQEEEYDGADLTIHRISATPDREVSW